MAEQTLPMASQKGMLMQTIKTGQWPSVALLEEPDEDDDKDDKAGFGEMTLTPGELKDARDAARDSLLAALMPGFKVNIIDVDDPASVAAAAAKGVFEPAGVARSFSADVPEPISDSEPDPVETIAKAKDALEAAFISTSSMEPAAAPALAAAAADTGVFKGDEEGGAPPLPVERSTSSPTFVSAMKAVDQTPVERSTSTPALPSALKDPSLVPNTTLKGEEKRVRINVAPEVFGKEEVDDARIAASEAMSVALLPGSADSGEGVVGPDELDNGIAFPRTPAPSQGMQAGELAAGDDEAASHQELLLATASAVSSRLQANRALLSDANESLRAEVNDLEVMLATLSKQRDELRDKRSAANSAAGGGTVGA